MSIKRPITLDDLRRYAATQSLFPPTTLSRALDKLGFVQADPIRAPARAQDLILRHRVKNYRAGDLDRRYEKLSIEEDFFINYGFVTSRLHEFMHPRSHKSVPAAGVHAWSPKRKKQALLLLEFVRERGAVHPREVDEHFSHGTVENYWGGSSNATTFLLDAMHYRGMLRIAKREAGIRIYSVREHNPEPIDAAGRRARLDALVDIAIRIYAPVPAVSISYVLGRLRYAVPQWGGEVAEAIRRAKERLSHTNADGLDWYWPSGESASGHAPSETVRLLAPFDPVVWDRKRFELLWGWPYRFEAYTPVSKRKLGYYALPLLWQDHIIGWANLSITKNGRLESEIGYVNSQLRDPTFQRELDAELDRIRVFLGLANDTSC
jgi:uncharacterized protein YcaQ